MPSWNWDESASESGVVHQSTANTDHNDAGVLKQGYDYAGFSEISPDPLHCWPLHEDSGTTANDLAGTSDGAYNGPTLGQTGLLGTTAPSFDGTDDNVDTGVQSVTPPCSFTAWVNIADKTNDRAILYNFNSTSDDAGIYYNDSSDVFVLVHDAGAGAIEGTTSLTTGTLYFIAGVIESSADIIYVNGSQEGSQSHSDTTTIDNGSNFYIGEQASGGFDMDGRVADVRIWDTALSASEVQTLYDVVDTAGSWTSTTKTL